MSEAPPPAIRTSKVLVLSYFNTPNFGDRLGYHVVNGLMPATAIVTHATLNPWTLGDEHYDLVIIGIGNSLNAPAIRRPELQRLIERTPHSLGIFGTQYPHQYREMMDPALFGVLIDKLTTWWARYEDDIAAFGGSRANVRHLGDWLTSAFSLATPTKERNLVIPADFMERNLPLDRVIQQIQEYRQVTTARIHPMLCAFSSADEVRYQEQRETADKTKISGKFAAQLRDIFGRSFEEDVFFKVDREAVIRYKLKVEANMAALKTQIAGLLA